MGSERLRRYEIAEGTRTMMSIVHAYNYRPYYTELEQLLNGQKTCQGTKRTAVKAQP